MGNKETKKRRERRREALRASWVEKLTINDDNVKGIIKFVDKCVQVDAMTATEANAIFDGRDGEWPSVSEMWRKVVATLELNTQATEELIDSAKAYQLNGVAGQCAVR